MILLLINACFLFFYAWLIFYYYRAWQALPIYEPANINNRIFISVIVAARNEAKNIPSLLQAMQLQSYPPDSYELIIVDDFSTDDTAALIRNASSANVRCIQPQVFPGHSSKKKSIEAGIATAQGELIVTTDADCYPPPRWLEVINAFYTGTSASFIAAPVKFHHDNSLLQIFQSIDFLTLQGITAASVGAGFHTMCNGANLAYRKQSFVDVHGFEGIDKVASGDDMLLMYKIWKKNPARVFYLKSRDVIVTTSPMPTLKDFIMQRKRWASKTLVYDDYRIIGVLAFVYLLNCLFVSMVIVSFFNPPILWYVVSFWIIKTLIEVPFVYRVAQFYQEQSLMKYVIFFQPLHIFYTVIIGLLSQLGRYEWKGRRTK